MEGRWQKKSLLQRNGRGAAPLLGRKRSRLAAQGDRAQGGSGALGEEEGEGEEEAAVKIVGAPRRKRADVCRWQAGHSKRAFFRGSGARQWMGRHAGSLLAKLRAASMTAVERQECARKGGLVGGNARAAKLTPKRRREIARKAAATRWGKEKK